MFYVDIDNKRFISQPPDSNSVSLQRPPSGCSFPPSCPPSRSWEDLCEPYYKVFPAKEIKRPVLVHTEVVQVPVTLLHQDLTPVDIGKTTFVLAVDDNFDHQDQLIAFAQNYVITDAANGVVTFRVPCSSQKFQKVLNEHVPAAKIMMQIVSYPPGSANGTAILQDRGIQLRPRVYTWQGAPAPEDPKYYTKKQINALLEGYIPGLSDSSAGKMFNGHGEPDPDACSPGDVYINQDDQGIWLRKVSQWIFFGYAVEEQPDLFYDIIEDV